MSYLHRRRFTVTSNKGYMCFGFATNEDDDELLTVRQRV